MMDAYQAIRNTTERGISEQLAHLHGGVRSAQTDATFMTLVYADGYVCLRPYIDWDDDDA